MPFDVEADFGEAVAAAKQRAGFEVDVQLIKSKQPLVVVIRQDKIPQRCGKRKGINGNFIKRHRAAGVRGNGFDQLGLQQARQCEKAEQGIQDQYAGREAGDFFYAFHSGKMPLFFRAGLSLFIEHVPLT